MTSPKVQKLFDLFRIELDEETAEMIDAMQPCVPVRGDFTERVLAGLSKHADPSLADRLEGAVSPSDRGVRSPTATLFNRKVASIEDSGKSTCHHIEESSDSAATSAVDPLLADSTALCDVHRVC